MIILSICVHAVIFVYLQLVVFILYSYLYKFNIVKMSEQIPSKLHTNMMQIFLG